MRTYILLLVLFILLPGIMYSQPTPGQEVQADAEILQERMFVHVDRTEYIAGDIMWMKVYLVDAFTRRPSPHSRVAYVEILDRAANSVAQAKIELRDGLGDGSLFLPVTLPSGNYLVRGYTSWMKNGSPDHFFQQTITIVNTQREYRPDSLVRTKPAIQFFPESGSLVNQVNSTVAFQALDGNGVGLTFSGTLLDESNNEVLRFEPASFGIGRFKFTPAAGHTYHAVIQQTDGSSFTVAMPEAQNTGYTIHVEELNGKLQVIATAPPATDKRARLVVHAAKRTLASMPINLLSGPVTIPIDVTTLHEGVNTLTLFNDDNEPVAERLYFRMPSKRLDLKTSADQQLHAQRERVSVTVSGSGAPAELSAAVYRVKPGQHPEAADIVAALWLGNELHGLVESPAAYFAEAKPASLLIDNLMLTHGYRKFLPQTGAVKSNTSYLPELEGPVVEGMVSNIRTGKPAADVQVFLSITGTAPRFYTSSSDSLGKIRFVLHDFYGDGTMIVQTNYRMDSIYKIEIRSPFAETALPFVRPYQLSTGDESWLATAGFAVQVQNAVHGEQLRTFARHDMDTLMFYNRPVEKYWLDDYKRFTTMEEVLREYVPGIAVRRRNGKLDIEVVNYTLKTLFEGPLLLLDGVPVFDGEQMLKYDPLKVRKLEVVNSRYVLGSSVFNGLSSWFTYKGDLDGFTPDPRAMVIDYEGLQQKRLFYSPVYETQQQRNSRIPDYRTLLEWIPSVAANPNSSFSFYTSDQPGSYLVVVQGIDKNGTPGSAQTMFEVK